MDYKKLFYSDAVQHTANYICEIARECWTLQLNDSTGFSITSRIGDTDAIIVDKSGTGFRRNIITPEDLILIDVNGNLLFKPENSENPRLAPVNVVIQLEGYKACDKLGGGIHWHDPWTNAFAAKGLTIEPFTLQSKLLGDVQCAIVDDRKEKKYMKDNNIDVKVPTGLHSRPDVYYVMKQAGEKSAKFIKERTDELDKHGIVVTHFEHGLTAWGRSVEEAFDNAYRSVRNAQASLFTKLLEIE